MRSLLLRLWRRGGPWRVACRPRLPGRSEPIVAAFAQLRLRRTGHPAAHASARPTARQHKLSLRQIDRCNGTVQPSIQLSFGHRSDSLGRVTPSYHFIAAYKTNTVVTISD